MNAYRVDILLPQASHGGVERVINMTALYLIQNGWQVQILQLVGKREWCDQRIPLEIVNPAGNCYTLEEIVSIYHDWMQEKGRPDLILAAVWPVMSTVAKRALARLVAETGEYERPTRVISWMHHGAVAYASTNGWGGYQELHDADGHLAINHYLLEELQQNFPEYPILRITNPVDFDWMKQKKIAASPSLIKTSGKKQMVFVGRISEEKRVDVIVEALFKVKEEWELTIIGSLQGAYEKDIFEQIRKLQLAEQIHFIPWMEDPWEAAEKMDVCVMASDLEGFPLVAIEALAHGIPIFSTPAEGMDELIRDGRNGYLYPFGDSDTLAKLLHAYGTGRLPVMDPELCRESVLSYDQRYVLPDFACKCREIVEHYEQLSVCHVLDTKLYAEDLVSLLIPYYEKDWVEQVLEDLAKESFCLRGRLQVVCCILLTAEEQFAGRLQQFELDYPDQILITFQEESIEELERIEQLVSQGRGSHYCIGSKATWSGTDALLREYENMKLYHPEEQIWRTGFLESKQLKR